MPTQTRATTATLQLASELRVALMRLTRRLRTERLDEGLSLTQLSVLGTLDRHGAMACGELAEHEKVQPPSMSRTIAALVELSLVSRSPQQNDKRQAFVEITPAGAELLRQDRRQREAWLAESLVQLTVQERQLLHEVAPLLDRLARS